MFLSVHFAFVFVVAYSTRQKKEIFRMNIFFLTVAAERDSWN